ncbi:MAG: hypothetical protein FJX34_00575 [Alphaproteobacteria bacterium]|nr:hypothetical protein [Alphaproteobacteria bacterium]
MKQTLIILTLLLTGCSSFRESLGQYNLPTQNIPEAKREGRVCYYTSDLKFWGSNIDFTIDSARRDGGITNIIAIEKEVCGNFLLRRKCIIVRGN